MIAVGAEAAPRPSTRAPHARVPTPAPSPDGDPYGLRDVTRQPLASGAGPRRLGLARSLVRNGLVRTPRAPRDSVRNAPAVRVGEVIHRRVPDELLDRNTLASCQIGQGFPTELVELDLNLAIHVMGSRARRNRGLKALGTFQAPLGHRLPQCPSARPPATLEHPEPYSC